MNNDKRFASSNGDTDRDDAGDNAEQETGLNQPDTDPGEQQPGNENAEEGDTDEVGMQDPDEVGRR